MLSPNNYHKAGQLTQFVSIDLIIKHQNKYLLGMRTNDPAKSFLFVPGSKTYKGNKLAKEVARITKFELGKEIGMNRIKFIGIFDHIYDTNFRDNSYGTHYVCNAVLIDCIDDAEAKLCESEIKQNQHSTAVWLTRDEIISSDEVHKFTKNYFLPDDLVGDHLFFRTGQC